MTQILVIDDDTIVLEIISEILQLAGYNVLTASNGEEGIKLINETQTKLIITDINMPVMDGNLFAEYIRKSPNFKDIPLLAITGTSWTIEKGLFDDVLRKPFKVKELLNAVELLIQ
jgi:CheY-like chemotaxis protein